MGNLMRMKRLVAWAVLGLAPVLFGATPADATSSGDRRETQRTAEATPAHRGASSPSVRRGVEAPSARRGAEAPAVRRGAEATPTRRGAEAPAVRRVAQEPQRLASVTPQRNAPAHGAAPTRASRLPSLVGTAHAALPMRGRLAETRDRHAALSNAQPCRTGAGHRASCARGPAMSWTRGLEPAAGIQAQECPDGTMATTARGHDNIVRCMPI